MRDVALFHTIATIVEENIDHGHQSYRVRSSIAIENDLAKTSVPYGLPSLQTKATNFR